MSQPVKVKCMLSNNQENELSTLILPKTDIILSSSKPIQSITQGLKKMGVDIFCYTRLYRDGSMLCLSDHAELGEMVFYGKQNLFIHAAPTIAPEVLKDQYFFYPCKNSGNVLLEQVSKNFKVSHVLTLVKQQHDCFDMYVFYTNCYERLVSTCLNAINILHQFIFYFQLEAKEILYKHAQDRLYQKISRDIKQKNVQFLEEHQMNLSVIQNDYKYLQIKIQKHFKVTPRELECLTWCVLGKSTEEIAMIIHAGKRTAEMHLANLKRKLNCHKQTELIRKAIALRLIDIDTFI